MTDSAVPQRVRPLLDLLAVRSSEAGTAVGRSLPGRFGRVFGGHVVAHALAGAAAVVPHEFVPSSLQTSFVNPGEPAVDVEYATTVVKPGRSLWLVEVEATQSSTTGRGVLLRGTFTFHRPEPGPEFQHPAPRVPRPDELAEVPYVPPGTDGQVRDPFELRYCDLAAIGTAPAPPLQQLWIRARDPLPDDPRVHAAALAYVTDLSLTRTAHMPLRAHGSQRLGASLDHCVWFHRPARADAWLLLSQESVVYTGSRALSVAAVFDEAGDRVATAVQEALIRIRD